MRHGRFRPGLCLRRRTRRPTDYAERSRAIFQGIRRADGRVGDAQLHRHPDQRELQRPWRGSIADAFRRNPFTGDDPLAEFPNVDGVVALTHKTGCGMTAGRAAAPAAPHARRLRAASRTSPHVIVLGLGCEVNQIGGLIEEQRLAGRLAVDGHPGHGRHPQDRRGRHRLRARVLAEANEVRRETVPASELTVALQCGGSDGYSGVSANPALGAAVDLLVRHGGTVDPVRDAGDLRRRAPADPPRRVSREVGEKLVGAMRWWEDYTAREGARDERQPVARQQGRRADHDPREVAGRDGQGAAAPTWSTSCAMPSRSPRKGFVFMDTPGYDPVSATGQVAGGANLVCFTTGRGSVFGCKPAPSIKLATNTPMFQRMEDDMDINCGTVLDGEETVQECGAAHLRPDAARRLRRADQERAVRFRRGGVRALGDWRDDVSTAGSTNFSLSLLVPDKGPRTPLRVAPARLRHSSTASSPRNCISRRCGPGICAMAVALGR